MFVSVPADHPRMVMVLQIKRVPAFPVQGFLPLCECPLELAQGEPVADVFGQDAVRHHRIELDHHIQHLLPSGSVFQCLSYAGKRRLPHLNSAVFQGDFTELPQIMLQVGAILIERQAIDRRKERHAVRKVLML